MIAAAIGNSHLAMRAFCMLNDLDRIFVNREFVYPEALPKAKYHRNDDQIEFYNAFFSAFEQSVPMSQELVDHARIEARTHGLSAIDACHVSATKISDAE
ncbi:MAG: hypothetical protein ETSY1_10615 [Candidatus Entotheonella factor]|uniref:Uncharacterized protein n=1 Tax=Entotheonella factor TaxID=1429438 RepID=W4LRI3_ENTF1|nr:MAG: hypothetical protein ETSY1_10615 [Candidatus Entotheonella factor]